jgi:iron complex transport system substrate-binding protein
VILRSDYRQGQYSGEQRWLSHPLARRVRGARTIPTDGRAWTCMGPLLAAEIERLKGLDRHLGGAAP